MQPDMINIDAWLEDSRPVTDPQYKGKLFLQPKYGYVPQNWNPGFPEVRSVVDRRPSQNGEFDYTTYFGARVVNLNIAIACEARDASFGVLTDQTLEDQLRGWMLPDLRPWLYVRFNQADEYRRIGLRSQSLGSGLRLDRAAFRMVACAWRCPDGVFEEQTLQQDVISAGGTGTVVGRTYPLAFPRVYTAAPVNGSKVIVNKGTAPTFPVIRVYGPCTQPRLQNMTTGKALNFLASFTVNAGEFLDINFRDGTVYLNGDLTNSRYNKIDFATGTSEWWPLVPGNNEIRFNPASFSAPSQAQIDWRSAYV